MWISAAVLSAFFAGLTSIFAKCGIRKTDSDAATAIRTIKVIKDGSVRYGEGKTAPCSRK